MYTRTENKITSDFVKYAQEIQSYTNATSAERSDMEAIKLTKETQHDDESLSCSGGFFYAGAF